MAFQQPYVYQPFPKMRYRADGQTKIVNSQEELDDLGQEWGGPEVVAPADQAPVANGSAVEPTAAPTKRGKKAQ